jgi:hypothetical protein
MRNRCIAALAFGCLTLGAQDRPDIRDIADKLNRLEEQNRQLMDEIRALRQQVAALQSREAPAGTAEPPLAERMAVQEQRVEELQQTKVGAEQRLPVSLTGVLLFNAFLNGKSSGAQMNPVVAAPSGGEASGGATLRQSIVGLRFRGPELAGGGKVTGAVFVDLFAGTGTSLNQLARLRVANLDFAWKNTTLSFAQDKPIIAPREPDSLAQVGVSPLTGAGNLWLWQPQFRFEQRFRFGDNLGLRAQAGLYQTSEAGTGVSEEYDSTLAPSRPGWEGRFEFWGERNGRRFEIAPGFHYSRTHVIGYSVPSRIFSVDWLLRPIERVDFTGQFFTGENTGVIGGLRQGVTIRYGRRPRAVRALGGWAQITLRATPRLSFHLYGGQEDDRNADLTGQAIAKNQQYAGNVMFRLGPNVLASFEASQVRTTYLGLGTRLNPHYDLGLAYMF